MRGELQAIADAPEGTRNSQLNNSALRLGHKVAGGYLDEHATRAALEAAGLAAGLTAREVPATVNSGLSDGMLEPEHPPDRDLPPLPPVTVIGPIPVADDRPFDAQADAEPPEDDAAGSPRRSWQSVDLTRVLDGTWTAPQPTVGRRSDDRGLFYGGKVHTVASETEAGKSWMALSAVVDEMDAGHHVVYVDFEDDEGTVVGRLLALQVAHDMIAERFHYLRPSEALGTGINVDDLRSILTAHKPTLVVLDGITEAMTLHGLNMLDNVDVAAFGRLLPRRIAATGPAVVCLDHVVKAADNRGRYALGGVHKLNGLDGAALILENRSPFGIGLTGKSTVRISKDRPGQLRRHGLPSSGGMFWYGDLVLTSHDATFAEVSIDAPSQNEDDFRPTVLMQKIVDLLTTHPQGLSSNQIELGVKGRAVTIRKAREYLILDGLISNKTPYRLLDTSKGAASTP